MGLRKNWSKLSRQDKSALGLGAAFISMMIVAAIDGILRPSPPPTEEELRRAQSRAAKERKKANKLKLFKGKILRRARHRCENCGKTHRQLYGNLQVYYIDPDGDCTYDNLRALCDQCKNS